MTGPLGSVPAPRPIEPRTAGLGGSPKPPEGGLSGALSMLGYGPITPFLEFLYKLNSNSG